MKRIPFHIIKAAQARDEAAVQYILKHFDGYIASYSRFTYTDESGTPHTAANEEIRYEMQFALLEVIFSFEFRDPPDSFTG